MSLFLTVLQKLCMKMYLTMAIILKIMRAWTWSWPYFVNKRLFCSSSLSICISIDYKIFVSISFISEFTPNFSVPARAIAKKTMTTINNLMLFILFDMQFHHYWEQCDYHHWFNIFAHYDPVSPARFTSRYV